MHTKQYGTIRKQAMVVGDTVAYLNRHGQWLKGSIVRIFVEESGLIEVKRDEWHSVEVINLESPEYIDVRRVPSL